MRGSHRRDCTSFPFSPSLNQTLIRNWQHGAFLIRRQQRPREPRGQAIASRRPSHGRLKGEA